MKKRIISHAVESDLRVSIFSEGTHNFEYFAYPRQYSQRNLSINSFKLHNVGTDRFELLVVPGSASSSQRIVVEYAAFIAAEFLVAPSVNILPAYRTFP